MSVCVIKAPACPVCLSEQFWEPEADGVELLCVGCTMFEPQADAPPPSAQPDGIPGPLRLWRKSFQDVFRVLGNACEGLSRADIVERLGAEYAASCVPAAQRDIASPTTVSHALRALADAGYVEHAKFGLWRKVGA